MQAETDPRTAAACPTGRLWRSGLAYRFSIWESRDRRHTVLGLVGLGVVHRRLHIAAAVRMLDHGGLVLGEAAVHVDLLGRAQGQGGGESDENRCAHFELYIRFFRNGIEGI